MTVTTDLITRTRALLEAATAGPWRLLDKEGAQRMRAEPWDVGAVVADDPNDPTHLYGIAGGASFDAWVPSDADAALIAAAPSLLAEWVAEGERLQEAFDAMAKACDEYRRMLDDADTHRNALEQRCHDLENWKP
jgi:hypothetical protein